MMIDILIKEVLKKHDINDENLAAALAEIFDIFYEETQSKMSQDLSNSLRMNGIKI